VTAIPATFTIDADGVLEDQHVGDADIEGKLKKLIARAAEVANSNPRWRWASLPRATNLQYSQLEEASRLTVLGGAGPKRRVKNVAHRSPLAQDL
jgi:hypothetical protein